MARTSLIHFPIILAANWAVSGAPQTQPATRPADEEMLRLVVQLGDPAADRREQAEAQLRRIGKPALPLLAEAAKAGDPEISSRASRLVKLIENPPLANEPREQPLDPFAGMVVQDNLDILKANLDLQMQRLRLAPDKRREILADVTLLQKLYTRQPQEDDATRDRRLKQYFQASDALRKKLAEIKLDAGEFLPPPAKARLGIQCQTTLDGAAQLRLMVEAVVPDSRAAAMGLRPGDTILKADGQDIHDIADLRAILAQSKEPIRLDILRDDKPLVVKERKVVDESKP